MFNFPFFLSLSTTRRQVNVTLFGWFSICKFLLLSILLLSQALVSPVNAEWGRTAEDYIRLPLYGGVHICSDGNGGCWATGRGVGLSHVDRNGNLTWGDEPFFLQPRHGFNQEPVLADNGDVIVAMDVYNDDDTIPDIYLQRVNLDQELLWGNNGIPLDTCSSLKSVADVYKGPVDDTYLIRWGRHTAFGVRLQLVNGDGDFLWGADGIDSYRSRSRGLIYMTISSDRCVIAAYSTEMDDEGDMEVLKINSDGRQVWDSRFSTRLEDKRTLILRDTESDRAGGIILLYEYSRLEYIDDGHLYHFGIKAMRISGDGDSLWTRQVYERETEFRGETPGQLYPIMNYAGSGHFLIAWADYPHSFKVVALDIDGEYIWDEPVDVITRLVGYGKLDAVDSDNSVCYVWEDTDNDREILQLQFGQRISAEGERLWGDRGRAIQAKPVWYSSITTDGNGGVITVVTMAFPTIQMINRNGEIGVVLETGVDADGNKQKSSKLSPKPFIYPNPANSQFRIEYNTGIPKEIFSYGIYNLMGRMITSGMMMGGQYVFDDLSRFSSGEYILQLQSERRTVSTRFSLIK